MPDISLQDLQDKASMTAAAPPIRCRKEPVSQVDKVMGESCAAAQVLKQLETARADGKGYIIYLLSSRWLVGSPESIQAAIEAAQTMARRAFRRGWTTYPTAGIMRHHRTLIACALLATAGAASSQQGPVDEGLQTLRGFRIGARCTDLEASVDVLRREGFKVAPSSHTCFNAPGQYHTDPMLLEEDGKSELVELSFAPDSTLWRVKVSLTWEGIHRLSEKPTAEQVNASLVKRFGTPYLKTSDGALLRSAPEGMHAVAYAWAASTPTEGPRGSEVDSFGWSRWSRDMSGIVTQANLRWSDDTSRQTLVVEMTNRGVLPLSLEAQKVAEQERAARKAAYDASMLKKL